jgi:hypothetical protein
MAWPASLTYFGRHFYLLISAGALKAPGGLTLSGYLHVSGAAVKCSRRGEMVETPGNSMALSARELRL